MIYRKQYIQFNEWVFHGATSDDSSTPFKTDSTSYTFTHGGYSARKSTYSLAEDKDVSLSVTLQMRRLPCEARPYYIDFAIGQLAKPGKLWAVRNNQLLWAHAEVKDFTEPSEVKKDTYEMDLTFHLPEGIWHKADLKKTFLKPWDECDFLLCNDFQDLKCSDGTDGDCCKCGEGHFVGCTCCECQGLDEDMALCFNRDKIQSLYDCDHGYKIVYSCDQTFFDVGTKMCTTCGTIAGQLYSNTDIPTPGLKIRFDGVVTDPLIEINGNANRIKGSYENLHIYPDGTFTYGCGECYTGKVENWIIPIGNTYGWTIEQGNNRVIIETGNCCGALCVWIEADALTY